MKKLILTLALVTNAGLVGAEAGKDLHFGRGEIILLALIAIAIGAGGVFLVSIITHALLIAIFRKRERPFRPLFILSFVTTFLALLTAMRFTDSGTSVAMLVCVAAGSTIAGFFLLPGQKQDS